MSWYNKYNITKENQEVLERTNSHAFLICLLLEVLEPNLMELNLSELTSTLFKSIKLNLKIYYSKLLVVMVTMEHNQYNPTI
jgi:hypothetical protein